jgi:hypothetical protein
MFSVVVVAGWLAGMVAHDDSSQFPLWINDDVQEHHLQGSLLKSPVIITLETKPTRDFHGFIKLISSIALLARKMKWMRPT